MESRGDSTPAGSLSQRDIYHEAADIYRANSATFYGDTMRYFDNLAESEASNSDELFWIETVRINILMHMERYEEALEYLQAVEDQPDVYQLSQFQHCGVYADFQTIYQELGNTEVAAVYENIRTEECTNLPDGEDVL